MEIKAELLYPYTQDEKTKFIVEQNHRNGYEIREIETEYEKTNIIYDYEDKEIIEENEAPKYEFQDVTTIIEVNDYDEEGNVIGTHQKEQIEKKMVQVGTIIEKTARIEKVLIGTHEEKELVKGINLQAWGYTEEEIEKQKKEQIGNLELTSADVERAIYEAKGMDFDDLVQFVIDSKITGFDVKRLKIELKANHFVRKHPYINIIGEMLGYSSDDMDYLFLNKKFPEKDVTSDTQELNND